MSESEPPPPKEALSEKQQLWITRTWRRLANRWKWPGWGLLALLLLKDVPDWKSRLDFWLDAARTAGGYASMAAIVIGSPYFSIGLAIAGIAWLVLVGEPRKGVQRHHWLPYLGWSVFGFCLTAIVVSAGWGAIEVYIQNEVNRRASHEVVRDIKPEQNRRLHQELEALTDNFEHKLIIVGAINNERESVRYAGQFIEILADVKLLNQVFHPPLSRIPINVTSGDLDMHGIFIGVPDPDHPPKTAELFYSALWRSGLIAEYRNRMDARGIRIFAHY